MSFEAFCKSGGEDWFAEVKWSSTGVGRLAEFTWTSAGTEMSVSMTRVFVWLAE